MASNPWEILARARQETNNLPSMYMQLQQQRISDLYRAKQLELAEKESERKDREAAAKDRAAKTTAGIISLYMKGGDPSASGSSGASSPSPSAQAPQAPVEQPTSNIPNGNPLTVVETAVHPLDAHPIDQPLPPRTDGVTLNQPNVQSMLAELAQDDPQQAMQLQKFIYDSDKTRLDQVARRGEVMAKVATDLGTIPDGPQRQAAFRAYAPALQEQGYTPEQIAQTDLSDRGLARYRTLGNTMAGIAAQANADRDFVAREDNRREDNARADAGLGIRREALKLAEKKEGRIASGGASGGAAGLSTDALLGVALGN